MQMAGFSYHSENEGETDRQRLQVAQMIHENSKKLIMAPWKSVTPKDVDYIHLDGGEKTELLKLCSFLTEAKYEYLRNDLDLYLCDHGIKMKVDDKKVIHYVKKAIIDSKEVETEVDLPRWMRPRFSPVEHMMSLILAEMAAERDEEIIDRMTERSDLPAEVAVTEGGKEAAPDGQ